MKETEETEIEAAEVAVVDIEEEAETEVAKEVADHLEIEKEDLETEVKIEFQETLTQLSNYHKTMS